MTRATPPARCARRPRRAGWCPHNAPYLCVCISLTFYGYVCGDRGPPVPRQRPACLSRQSKHPPNSSQTLAHALSQLSLSRANRHSLSGAVCGECCQVLCAVGLSRGLLRLSPTHHALGVWAASVVIYSTVVSAHGGRRSAGRLGGLFVVAHLRRLNLYFSRPHACGSSCGSRSSTPYSRGSRPHARRSTHTYKASPTRAQLRWSQAAAPWLLVRAPHWLYTSCGHKSP